jgi:iron complex outermembrane recepter protein
MIAPGRLISSLTLSALLAVPLVAAEEQGSGMVPTLTVTGEFRATELQQMPASLSIIARRDIAARNAQHLDQIIGQVPNLHHSGGTSRGRYFQIRGIGERSEFARPLNASVGLMVDGVDFSGIGTAATLHDVRQVEIFRGPQGTRYGANGLAGVINVLTQEPTRELDAGLNVRAGNYGSHGVGAYVSGPASDTLSYRLAGERYRSDGFIRNVHLDRRDTDAIDELTLRGRMRWEPSAGTAVDVMLGHVDADNGFDAFSLDNTRRTLADAPGHDRQRSNFGTATLTLDASERVWLEARAAHSATRVNYGYDEDWTFAGFHPRGYTSFDNYRRDHRRTTLDVRLLSSDVGRLFAATTDWVAGVYWHDQSVDFRRDYTYLNAPFESEFDTRRYAAYGQTETLLSDLATLTVGLRVERHASDYRDSQQVAFRPAETLYGGRVALDYLMRDHTLVYVSIARGYKASGFNLGGQLDADLRRFDPEVLINYEVGAKGSWLDDALQGRMSLFYMRRHDAQLSTSLQRVRDDGTTDFIQYTDNTGSGSDNLGLEAELEWQPFPALSMSGALGLLRAEYGNYVNATGADLSGRRQPHAPSYQFHTAAEYRFTRGIYVRAELEGRARFYFSDAHDARSDAFELVHLTLGWRSPQWSVQLWTRNLLNETYPIRGFFFGNDPRTRYAPMSYVQLGEPRRIGLSAAWHL